MRNKSERVKYGYCLACNKNICLDGKYSWQTHAPDCKDKDATEHYLAMCYSQKDELWARDRLSFVMKQLEFVTAKLAQLKAENNKLRNKSKNG